MTVLVIAPHADDETLGMGGTIARLTAEGRRVVVAVMTGPGAARHPIWPDSLWDKIHLEATEAARILGVAKLLFKNLPAACVADLPIHEVNQAMADVISQAAPEELYLPYYHDLHQDHASVSYAALVHARPYLQSARHIRLVAMYETPTETHLFPAQLRPAFSPNMWIDISGTLQSKLSAWACYQSQHQAGETPRSIEAIRALATVRGAEIGCAAAEGFILLRLTR
ncbi:MAG: PIG-L family deacetylase [Pseudomonadota bacterium]|nr:PIG-L family deacetylase [Pseudomonadota bacterium]